MRHVQDRAAWMMTETDLTIEEALDIQYLSVLLHESCHVATTRLYELDGIGPIARSGIRLYRTDGSEIGNLHDPNEALTDMLADAVYQSASFRSRFPNAEK